MAFVGSDLVLSGVTSPVPTAWNLRVARLSAGDQTLWSKDFGATDGQGRSVLSVAGADIVVSATVTAPVQGVGDIADVRLLRLDADGAVVSDAVIGPSSANDRPSGLLALPGGHVVLAIHSTSDGPAGQQDTGTVRRLDSANNEVWRRDLDHAYFIAGLDGDAVVAVATIGAEGFHIRRIALGGTDSGEVVVPPGLIQGAPVVAAAFADGRAALLASGGAGTDASRDLGLTVVTPCFAAPCAPACP